MKMVVAYPGSPDRLIELFLPQGFQAAGGHPLLPTEFAGVVVPTMEFPPAVASYETAFHKYESATSGAGVSNITLSTTPGNRYRYLYALAGAHNDPAARVLSLQLIHPATGNVVGLKGTGGAVSLDVQVMLERPIIVAPAHTVRVIANAIAAGQVVAIYAFYLELPLAIPHPKV